MPQPHLSTRWATQILKRGLWVFVVGVLLVLWSLVLSFNYTYRSKLIETSTKELVQQNSLVAQHTYSLFRSVETDLRVVDRWLQRYPGKDPLHDPQFVALIDDLRKLSGGLIDIRMVSSDGQLHYIPDPEQPLADVSDRAYYRAQLNGGPQVLHIGDPVLGRVTGKWTIPVSWRLSQEVAGLQVVFAALELDRLTEPHDRWRMKEHGSIVLVREDGRLLSRAPFDARLIGMDFSGTPEYKMFHGTGHGSFIFDSRTTDRIARIVSFERLQDGPLVAVTTRGLDEALAPYYTLRRTLLWTAAAVSLLVLLFAVVIHRTQRSLFQAQRRLQRLALTDDLTRVMNRRAFMMQAGKEFARAQRHQEGLALLMVDIDHFKQVNDKHGHAVGDEVLAALPGTWSRTLRRNDVLGRIGGEEFCIALPNTSSTDALDIAQRLCELSALARVSKQVAGLRVTISIGLAWSLEADKDWLPILERADQALYRAKANGRNRVETQTTD
ncbi:sensor domain-containing diguanylate cyclase [Uliginosibacterium sp. H3]|uniref:diguanylate cyclase n=1 Tax=Uliginosibacterium silvisoli TaxID=3114758 RepID=A0ABU6K4K0_9RHOO|nr:sensor domain-containing diguanylate cyclase [Uliginosibacterium sp. H3]